MVKKGVLQDGKVGFSSGFKGSFFRFLLRVPNFVIFEGQKFFLFRKIENLDLKGVIEKYISCFLAYVF